MKIKELFNMLNHKFTMYFLGCFVSLSFLGCFSNEVVNDASTNQNEVVNDASTNQYEDLRDETINQESKLFDDLFNLTNTYDQFEGTAFVGSLNGQCYMVLTSNSQNDKIVKLRYQILNYVQGKVDKLDETYTVSNLQRKSKNTDGLKLNKTDDYIDAYLFGSVKGLKSSINDGLIEDISGTGDIFFVLDSVNYKLTYVVSSTANWSFQGDIDLNTNQYIEVKELFTNQKLSKEEQNYLNQPQVSTSDIDTTSSEIKVEENGVKYNYEGRIDKYPIRALINWGEGYHKEGTGEFIIPITGYYYYIKSGVPIEFEGRANGPNNVHLVAQTAGGLEVIDYEESENGVINGTWKKDGKELLIEMHSID